MTCTVPESKEIRLPRRSHGVALGELLRCVEPLSVRGGVDVAIEQLATDSRRAGPRSLFFAVPGVKEDGARFAADAVKNGAIAIIAETDVAIPGRDDVTLVRVADCRLAKARIADRFFGAPSTKLPVIGVTGTNGKTTTTWMLRSIAEYDACETVLIGTIGYEVGGETRAAPNTTPDSIELHETLRDGLDAGAGLAVMEVSSHSLEQARVAGVEFSAGVLTNVTPEHLDFHGTFEAYRAAKRRLFEMLGKDSVAVLNAEDPATDEYAAATKARVIRYGLAADGAAGSITARVRRLDIDGMSFILKTPRGDVDVNCRLVGRHNLMNALAASAAAYSLGFPLDAIRGGFEMLTSVPGRLESVDCGQDFRVLIDYAHTHDALQNVLESLRPLTKGRLITVFGCGGNRDKQKRPRMGEVVTRLSDLAVVTSDNPRNEEPLAIIEEIQSGIAGGCPVIVEPDRRAAIEAALRSARGGDIVLIAGKGHETRQIFKSESIEFDDRSVAREILWNRS